MSNNDELRWKQRFENFELAFNQLVDACEHEEYSNLEFAGLIKTFEIAFEMAWKTLKDLLFFEGYDARSPRATIQQSLEMGYITDPRPWLDALESRNILSHKYDKEVAEDTEELIKGTYLPMLREVIDKLKNQQDTTK